MASPETIGTCACDVCGTTAYVKKNRGQLPYYRCGACDWSGQAHSQRASRAFMKKVTLMQVESEEDAPEKAAKSEAPKLPQKKSGFAAMLEF